MSEAGPGGPPPPELRELVGAPESSLRGRFGEPAALREVGEGGWWRWSAPGWELRVRCAPGPGGEGRVASWSLLWSEGRPTLREAVEPLGLWPAASPDVTPEELDLPLARRGLSVGGGPERSLTVGSRGGRFVRVTCFDEEPDWR